MAKASINFKPVKSNSQAHNERLTNLDYNFPDLVKDNESWKAAEISDREKQIRSHCKKVSGRKLMSNAAPIREAVVNLNSHHTLEDLQKLAQVLREKEGIDCFQIHIHRDEGIDRENLNYHAHMLFDWQDKKTGKVMRLGKIHLSQIQTIVADTLKMERGELKVNSNRERLEPVEYKRQQEEKRLAALQSQVEELEQKKNRAAQDHAEASGRYRAAEDENRNLTETEQSQKSDFKTRIARIATQGIQGPEKWPEIEENDLGEAIKLQLAILEKQQSEIAEAERKVSNLENEALGITGNSEFAAAWNTYKRLEAEFERLEKSK